MNCPFCNKRIAGLSGLQEIKNFMSHLNTLKGCKKNPKRTTEIDPTGPTKVIIIEHTDMLEALELRSKSNQ